MKKKTQRIFKNQFELRSIGKVSGYKINIQKPIAFLYFDNKHTEMEKILS